MNTITTTGFEEVYRGIRRDRDNVAFDRPRSRELECGFSFWAVNRSYAEEFGPIILEAHLLAGAHLLDLTDSDIDGEELNTIAPHVAKALKIDVDDLVDPVGIWERIGDDVAPLAEALRQDGFDGLIWLENRLDVAIFVANHDILGDITHVCAEEEE